MNLKPAPDTRTPEQKHVEALADWKAENEHCMAVLGYPAQLRIEENRTIKHILKRIAPAPHPRPPQPA